jgi:hypothetical protein
VNGATHAAPWRQLLVGGVHDRVDSEGRDVDDASAQQPEILGGSALSLEVLDSALVLFRGGSGLEGAQVAPLARFGVFLPRVEAILTGSKFTNHPVTSCMTTPRQVSADSAQIPLCQHTP